MQEENRNIIIIEDREALIQEIGGRRKFCLSYSKDKVTSFHINILKEGLCNAVIKTDVIKKDEEIMFFYDFSGFVQFESVINQWITEEKCLAQELIRTFVSVIDCILDAENNLISPELFSLNLDTIFIDPISLITKIAYIPGSCNQKPTQESLIDLIKTTKKLINDDQFKAYSEIIIEEIYLNNYGLYEIKKSLIEKSREIYSKEWPIKALEREIGKEELLKEDGKISKFKWHFPFK